MAHHSATPAVPPHETKPRHKPTRVPAPPATEDGDDTEEHPAKKPTPKLKPKTGASTDVA